MAIRIAWPDTAETRKRKAFTESLIPECPLPSSGATIPECRRLAKSIADDEIEIRFIEDVLVKGIMIFSAREPFSTKRKRIEAFLPLVVSWLVTDTVSSSLRLAKGEEDEAFAYFLSLIDRTGPMTRRLGIVTLMRRPFLTSERMMIVLDRLAAVETDHHLLMMGAAWYVATAYTLDAELTRPYFMNLAEPIKRLAKQKCRDSRRIDKAGRKALDSI